MRFVGYEMDLSFLYFKCVLCYCYCCCCCFCFFAYAWFVLSHICMNALCSCGWQ